MDTKERKVSGGTTSPNSRTVRKKTATPSANGRGRKRVSPRKPKAKAKKAAKGKLDKWLFFKRWPAWTIWCGALLLGAAYVLFFYYFFVGPSSLRWKAIYGDPIYPEGFDIHGIDVSHYQEDIDWEVVRNASLDTAPVSFVFIKATEGVSLLDENFNLNFYEAKQNGLIRGAYHFFIPNIDARAQARFFLKQVHLEPGDLPPVLDVEKAGDLTVPQLQKAETAVNTDCHTPLPQPMTGTKEKQSRNAPTTSHEKVTIIIYFTSFLMPSKFTNPADCITSLRWESDERFCTYKKNTESMVISPRPPTCISTRITA